MITSKIFKRQFGDERGAARTCFRGIVQTKPRPMWGLKFICENYDPCPMCDNIFFLDISIFVTFLFVLLSLFLLLIYVSVFEFLVKPTVFCNIL